MKILFSGFHNPHFATITEYIERAIEKSGNTLIPFDDRQHLIPGRIREHLPPLNQFDLAHMNKKMLKLALDTQPDMAIISGGHRICGDTINALKKNNAVTVLWTTDAPIHFDPILAVAPYYDQIVCQGTEAIELLNKASITGAKWLPMACDPDVHRPIAISLTDKEQYGQDVVFVGSYYPNREQTLLALVDFDLAIWGPGWEQLPLDSQLRKFVRGGKLTPDEWTRIYCASKIVLTIHYQDPEGRIPVYQASPKIFEALACGAFVLSDWQRDVGALFDDGCHLAFFNDSHDLAGKVQYFLDHPEQRKSIANSGRTQVLAQHTYRHRIEELISMTSMLNIANMS